MSAPKKAASDEEKLEDLAGIIQTEQKSLTILKAICYFVFGLGIICSLRWSAWIGLPLTALGAFLLAKHDIKQWTYIVAAIFEINGHALKDKTKRGP